MNEYTARLDRQGTPCVFTPNGAVHSIHDNLAKAHSAAAALNNGGEKEYQAGNWDDGE